MLKLKYLFPILILLIAGFLCFKNYTPGTYLIGWDSLHPEFNFPEAFGRVWEGVWRPEQGVGAIAAHSHMADFPRILFLWLESFVLPASALRYSYIFLCLILGPLGMYFFLKYVFQKEKDSLWIYPAAFLGALSYLLNLGTLQNFYVPFEMFPAAFAFMPWLFFAGLKYLREGNKRGIIFFAVLVILSSPMAYAATLWYASFTGMFIFLGTFILISPTKKSRFKRFLALASISIFLSLYWILPNIYSIINQSATIANANINKLFSPEAFLRNRDYGDFKDILLQKNFLFGWRNFDFVNGTFKDLLGVWNKFLSGTYILFVGYVLAGISVLGLLIGVLKREKVILALIPLLFYVLFFLININPPTGGIYAYFYNSFGIFAEGFRMPFTKFSILYELLASFCFSYFTFVLLTIRGKFLPFLKILFVGAVASGIIYFMLPAFDGQLIGSNVRVQFPDEYNQLYDWFNSNTYGRVALFPINSKYGWEYRSWGYEGSGFLTYGINDPVLYRDFDRWSVFNENFYNEASFALYNNDSASFENILKKYQIQYLLLDESIINPDGSSDVLKIPELKTIFARNGFKEAAKFGFLTVYETNFDPGGKSVSAAGEYFGDYVGKNDTETPSGPPIITEDLSVNRGYPNSNNCDLEKIGSAGKSYVPDGILYTAAGGGVSCDFLNYPDLKYGAGYILRVTGENKEGRSLKIYLYNDQTENMDLEELLPPGKFDNSYVIYPKNLKGAGYTLNFETRSFGRISSENLVTTVEFYSDNLTVPSQNVSGIPNGLTIKSVQKYGTWAYKVDTEGSGLIELGQGYDSGWVAIPAGDFPFTIFHLPFLEHTKISSWANGWIIPPNQSINELTIYLFYWPQLLEWAGGVLGIAAFLIL